MYSKSDSNWLKHWDFIILDLILFQIAYVLSHFMRMGITNPYYDKLHVTIGIVIGLADIFIAFFTKPYHGIMRRGCFIEFCHVVKHVFLVSVLELGYLFLSQNGNAFSRLSFIIFSLISVVLIYIERLVWKSYLIKYKSLFYQKTKMLIVTTRREAEDVLETFKLNSFNEYEPVGIAYTGSIPKEGEKIWNIPVVCMAEQIPEYIRTKWLDAVFIRSKDRSLLPEGIIEKCIDMGITVHNCLEDMDEWTENQYINQMGGYMVLTSSVRVVSLKQVAVKRLIDIFGGIIGLIITGILTVMLGPIIYFTDPGPIFFSQVRIGKNGKPFRIYKFRSMYMDAEQRKKELMAKNEMKGLMFKMEADPRIIGSGPDGTHHGLGWFIRKTSLDEFPQFLNVLKGEMSLVGTRPPTQDEWRRYKYYHRARLAVKPGLTGIWQVSGRSDIVDFEEVVKLDMRYVKKWSIGMDIAIILKTVLVVFKGSGSK